MDTAQSLPAAYHQADPHTPKAPTHIRGFFVGEAEKQQQHDASMALFGPDFVTNVMEYFYIREKPPSPQPEDGVIKTPGAGQGQFRDGFKVDMVGHGISEQKTIRDLPSREVISTQRRRKSAFNTVMICAGAVADDRNLIASVTKHGEKKAIIEVKGATHYFAEGDLFDRNFKITKGTQVAQVCRDDSARAAVTSKHSYCVQVAAGTDCVLMIAVALAIEDLYHK